MIELTEKTQTSVQKKFQERIKAGEKYVPLNKYGIPSATEAAWIAKSNFIRSFVTPCYSFQEDRIIKGNIIVGNFFNKLGIDPGEITKKNQKSTTINKLNEIMNVDNDDMSEEELIDEKKFKFIEFLRKEYKLMASGLLKEKKNSKKKIEELEVRESLIFTSEAEKILMENYLDIEKSEKKMFDLLEDNLYVFGDVAKWLTDQFGVNKKLAGYLLAYLNPHRAPNPSCFHAYCGFGVGLDGKADCMSTLILKEYVDKKGKVQLKQSIKFQKDLKAKIVTCIGLNFIKKTSPWRKRYEEVRYRYEHRPDLDPIKDKARIYKMTIRVIAKEFLTQLWLVMRKSEGLSLTVPYHVAKLGMRDHNPLQKVA